MCDVNQQTKEFSLWRLSCKFGWTKTTERDYIMIENIGMFLNPDQSFHSSPFPGLTTNFLVHFSQEVQAQACLS